MTDGKMTIENAIALLVWIENDGGGQGEIPSVAGKNIGTRATISALRDVLARLQILKMARPRGLEPPTFSFEG
jgi:hypothetical protein